MLACIFCILSLRKYRKQWLPIDRGRVISWEKEQERDLLATTYYLVHLEFPLVCMGFCFCVVVVFLGIFLKSQF